MNYEQQIKQLLESEFGFTPSGAEQALQDNIEVIEAGTRMGSTAYAIAEEINEANEANSLRERNDKWVEEANQKNTEKTAEPYYTVLYTTEGTTRNSFENAYQVEKYPFGYEAKCRIRYWIETATKGSRKGQQRFCSCTTHITFNKVYTDLLESTDPEDQKKALELKSFKWNKPKCSTYHDLVIMTKDPQTGHVNNHSIYRNASPAAFAGFKSAFYQQLNSVDRAKYDQLEIYSRKPGVAAQSWAEWDAAHPEETKKLVEELGL